MKHTTLTLLLILGLTSIGFAQPGSVPVESHNGVKCHVHTISKGQTAYGISKMYDVSINELYEHNPEAEKGLALGAKLYLPAGADSGEALQQEVKVSDEHTIFHTAKKGDTYYSIARLYNVPVADVQNANGAGPITIGNQITVPLDNVKKDDTSNPLDKMPINPSVDPTDSVVVHKVKKKETLYSLTKLYNVSEDQIKEWNDGLPMGLQKGSKIRIIYKRKLVPVEEPTPVDTISIIEIDLPIVEADSGSYNLVVMLPFLLDKNEAKQALCPPVGDCPIYGTTMNALNLRNGILMAVDSLSKAGKNINVSFYDTKNDTAVVKAILRKPEMRNAHLIVGPLFTQQIKLVSKYAKSNQIQMVCPLPVTNKALFNNPYVSKMAVSKPTQVEFLADYLIAHEAESNIVLMRNKEDKKDEYAYNLFKKRFNDSIGNADSAFLDSVKLSHITEHNALANVEYRLVPDRKNIIVVPSSNTGYVSTFMTKMSATYNKPKYKEYQFEIYALEEWIKINAVEEKYKNRFGLHVVSDGYVDFQSPKVERFIAEYRSKFGIDPDKFSFVGFDATYSNLMGAILYGKGFSANYSELKTKGYYTDSYYEAVDENSGFENQNLFILKYSDFRLEKLEK